MPDLVYNDSPGHSESQQAFIQMTVEEYQQLTSHRLQEESSARHHLPDVPSNITGKIPSIYSFRTSDTVIAALDALGDMKQEAGESVSSFYARYIGACFHAGVCDKDDSILLANNFFTGLSVPLKQKLRELQFFDRTSLEDVITSAISLEEAMNDPADNASSNVKMQKCKQVSHEERRHRMLNFLCLICGSPDHVKINCPESIHADSANSLATPSESVEIDENISKKHARLSRKERQYRVENGLCIVCASPDHIKTNCPISLLNLNRATTAQSVPYGSISSLSRAYVPFEEQRKYCLQNRLCLMCGSPDHMRMQCPLWAQYKNPATQQFFAAPSGRIFWTVPNSTS